MARKKAKTDAMIAQPGTLESGYTLKVDYDPENDDEFSAKAIYNNGTIKDLTSSGGGGAQNILDGSETGSLRTSGSTAEGSGYTIGQYAFAEGFKTQAHGMASHAENCLTVAEANYSHAEGYSTSARGSYSHAEGVNTIASGVSSHAGGNGTIAKVDNQHVIGKYNVVNDSAYANQQYAFIIGNGTSNNARSNAFAVKWDGTIVVWNNGTAVELTPAKIAELIGG